MHALLARGVRDVVLCPGSRSAPLAYALEAAERAGQVRLHVRHDERSAAFVALGCAAADPSVPAAVVTTSGTAVANLHPAVMEAHHAGLPLLLLTADRPARLRGTWANQTTDLQPDAFGRATRRTVVVEAAEVDDWTALADGLVAAATGAAGRPGPVHLDLGYDDPLVPSPDDPPVPDAVPDRPAPDRPAPAATGSATPGPDATVLEQGPRTLVVAGAGAGPHARALAEQAGWPLLAEPSSGAKGGPNRVGAYRLLLENASLAADVERVVAVGRPTLSRPVTRLLGRPEVELVQVVGHPDDVGPEREVRRVVGPVTAAPTDDDAWLRRWTDAGRRAEQAVDAVLDARSDLCGPWLAREIACATGSDEVLVVASSNPVRDLDLVAPPRDGARVLANRGLAGIDGTVSTAVGAAAASGRATRLLVGDLAALHDLGGLVVPEAERSRLRLQVVVLDDDGGGIFGLLEHARHPASFERVFGTPHGADLVQAARGLGARASRAADRADVTSSLRPVPPGLSVLVVPADRASLVTLHGELRAAVRAAGPDAETPAPSPVRGPRAAVLSRRARSPAGQAVSACECGATVTAVRAVAARAAAFCVRVRTPFTSAVDSAYLPIEYAMASMLRSNAVRSTLPRLSHAAW